MYDVVKEVIAFDFLQKAIAAWKCFNNHITEAQMETNVIHAVCYDDVFFHTLQNCSASLAAADLLSSLILSCAAYSF